MNKRALRVPLCPDPSPSPATLVCREGLGPRYWKQPHHFDDWTTYVPEPVISEPSESTPPELYDFNTIFGVEVSGDPTLLEALQARGGKPGSLLRLAAAALLNAAHPSIDYAYTVDEVIGKVQAAFAEGDPSLEDLRKILESGKETEDGGLKPEVGPKAPLIHPLGPHAKGKGGE